MADIQRWMQANDLKLNQDKTEIVLIYAKFKAYIDPPTIQIGDDMMFPQLPPTLANLISTCVAMIKSASPHSTSSGTLLRLEIILLILQQRVWVMNSLLGYCNSLFYGPPEYLLKRLESIPNSA